MMVSGDAPKVEGLEGQEVIASQGGNVREYKLGPGSDLKLGPDPVYSALDLKMTMDPESDLRLKLDQPNTGVEQAPQSCKKDVNSQSDQISKFPNWPSTGPLKERQSQSFIFVVYMCSIH